jgi:hypothetical protein
MEIMNLSETIQNTETWNMEWARLHACFKKIRNESLHANRGVWDAPVVPCTPYESPLGEGMFVKF